jgi:hypothetical protein
MARETISLVIQTGCLLFVIVFAAVARRQKLCIGVGIIVMSVANVLGNIVFGEGHAACAGVFIFPLYGGFLAWITVRIANAIAGRLRSRGDRASGRRAVALLLACILTSCNNGVSTDNGCEQSSPPLPKAQAVVIAVNAIANECPQREFQFEDVMRAEKYCGWFVHFRNVREPTTFGASRLVLVTDDGRANILPGK